MCRCFLILLALVITVFGKRRIIEYGEPLETTKFPKNFQNSETLKEFIDIVENNKLNVSVIISRTKNYEEGNVKEVATMTMTLPVNNKPITKATLNKECYKKLDNIAKKEQLTIAASSAIDNETNIYTNNKKALPINRAYKILTGIKNGQTGFVFDSRNYLAQYTFLNKEKITKVYYSEVELDTTAKSENLTEDYERIIKKAFTEALYESDEKVMPEVLSSILAKQLPNYQWDAACKVGEDSYLDSEQWIRLKFLEENYLVFTKN